MIKHRLPARLHVALLDGDPTAHESVRRAIADYAPHWRLDCHHSTDSLLAALHRKPRVPHSTGPHAQVHKLSTPHTINQHLVRADGAPDVVLVDAEFLGVWAIHWVRRLDSLLPQPRILILTNCLDRSTLVRTVAAGACGCVIKPIRPACLVEAVSAAAAGQAFLCGEALAAVVAFVHQTGAAKRRPKLNWREREIMLLLLEGLSEKEIATKLGIGEGTVHWHKIRAFKKLHAHSKEEAVCKFVGGGAGLQPLGGEFDRPDLSRQPSRGRDGWSSRASVKANRLAYEPSPPLSLHPPCGVKTYCFPTVTVRPAFGLMAPGLWFAWFQRAVEARAPKPAEERLGA